MALKHSNEISPRVDRKTRREFVALAPYNFVPLPEQVVVAPTPLDHDAYYESGEDAGISGWIDVALQTCSPVYVRGLLSEALYAEVSAARQKNKNGEAEGLSAALKIKQAGFYGVPANGQPMPRIPGSTLRGMVRGLVEIASYGRMRWVGKAPTFSYRAVAAANDDPLREPYQQAFGKFGANVRAGFLRQEGEQWTIAPAQLPEEVEKQWQGNQDKTYLKVREDAIGSKDISGYKRFDNPNYTPAYFHVSFDAEMRSGLRGKFVALRRIADFAAQSNLPYAGWLVCSGNMLENNTGTAVSPRKKHALVMPPDETMSKRLTVPEQVVKDYLDGLTDFQKKDLETSWKSGGEGCLKHDAPVFYIAEGKTVLYFGHSPNFRIPMRLAGGQRAATPPDFVPEAVLKGERPDFADAIFGWVKELEGPADQRSGRVFFEDGRLTDAAGQPLTTAPADIWLSNQPITPRPLSTPKPTTFQHYLVQDAKAGHNPNQKASLAHYGTNPQHTELRGHKLYWHQGADVKIGASEEDKRDHESQLTRISPLKAGVRFAFRIRFENLRSVELGALLWALTLPGSADQTYRHKLGMGKPLGMGAVQLTSRLHVTNRAARYTTLLVGGTWNSAAAEADVLPHVLAFEHYVLKQLGYAVTDTTRLADLERIQDLLMLLSWPGPDIAQTRYLEIERVIGRKPNGKEDTVNEYKERPALPAPAQVLRRKVKAEAARVPVVSTPLLAGFEEGKVESFGQGPNGDYGFIRAKKDGERLFVHLSFLAAGTQTLKQDERVRYKRARGPRGWQAKEVQVLV